MKPGLWYKLASYVFEIPVEKRKSQYSGEVAVSFHRGQYKLSSKNAIYSFGKNYTSLSVPFNALGIRTQNISTVLVLGFGLGSAASILENNQHIQKIVAVDSDAVILELAKKYMQSALSDKVEYVCEDAAVYIQNNREQFDLVLFDIFIDEKTPVQFMSESFLNTLHETMSKNGILLYSKMDMTNFDHIENKQFEQTFARVFPEAFSILADGNKIFYSGN